jgi:23S rRNA-intervening sequence protein
MSAAKSFRDLRVYELARASAGEIFEATKSFPLEERYSLADQICRSSRATKAGSRWLAHEIPFTSHQSVWFALAVPFPSPRF